MKAIILASVLAVASSAAAESVHQMFAKGPDNATFGYALKHSDKKMIDLLVKHGAKPSD